MEENGTKINPEDVRISDIGRALLNLPRAIYRKFKEKRQAWKATKEEQLAAKKARKETKKAKRAEKRKNNFFRRTIANILNTNHKEVDRIKKRNEEEATCLNEDPVTPTADTPVSEQQSPTNDGKKSDSSINLDQIISRMNVEDAKKFQQTPIEDLDGKEIEKAGIRVVRITKKLYLIIIKEKDNVKVAEVQEPKVLKLS